VTGWHLRYPATMKDEQLAELIALLSSARVGERLRAMDHMSVKSGRATIQRLDDSRVVPLLIQGLGDGTIRSPARS
jgi:hypothetical protein